MHNKYRNEIALGKIPHYDSATNMATVKWDDELAKLAELVARTCLFKRDKCRNTGDFTEYIPFNIELYLLTLRMDCI